MEKSKEVVNLYNKFAEKYGLNLVEDLELLMSKIYEKIKELEKSRNNWKNKYIELKNGKDNK